MEIDTELRRRLLVARVVASAIASVLAILASLAIAVVRDLHQRDETRIEFRLYTCRAIEEIKRGNRLVLADSRQRIQDSPLFPQSVKDEQVNALERYIAIFKPINMPCERFARLGSPPPP